MPAHRKNIIRGTHIRRPTFTRPLSAPAVRRQLHLSALDYPYPSCNRSKHSRIADKQAIISTTYRNNSYLCIRLGGIREPGGQPLADFESGKRKVWATQSTMVVNGNLPATAEQCDRKLPLPPGAVRVKRRGKSSPDGMATYRAAHLMGCKVKYTGIQGLLAHCRGVDCYRGHHTWPDQMIRQRTS